MGLDDVSHATALRRLTRFPTGSAIWIALFAVGGLAYAVTLGSGGVNDGEVRFSRAVPLVVGLGVSLVALGLLGRVLRVWRRDVRAAALVADDRPEGAWAGPTMTSEATFSLFSGVLGAAAIVAVVTLVLRAADGAAWGWATLVGLGVLGFSLLIGVSWRGHEYVGVHADGIRILRHGRLTVGPWSRVQSFEGGRVGVVGERDRVGVDGEVRRRISERAASAWLASFEGRLEAGDVVDLGEVTLERDALVIDGERVAWREIGRVELDSDPENSWVDLRVTDRAGRRRGSVRTSSIANRPVLDAALARFAGVAVIDPRR